jgi:ribosomal protein S12 methylthiotransferase
VPGIALRTTFIVGFPGETEEYFESLLDFIRQTRFERLGVFTYSQQDGTRAGKMEGQTPDARKKQRQKKAMAEQLKIAREISASRVGTNATVLVERAANGRDLESASVSSWEHGLIRASQELPKGGQGSYWLARGEADAPDIDGRVYVRGTLPAGEFARVKVIGHTDYDLIAEPA